MGVESKLADALCYCAGMSIFHVCFLQRSPVLETLHELA